MEYTWLNILHPSIVVGEIMNLRNFMMCNKCNNVIFKNSI